MPRVFRIMRKEPDNLPRIGPTDLGVRPTDVDVDAQNNVLVNGKGMSVAPSWRDININRIPKRLRAIVPGAGGANNVFCFCSGTGPFQQGPFAYAWTLEPDAPTHGNIAPALSVSMAAISGRPWSDAPKLAGRRDMMMTKKPLTMNPNYLAMVRGTRELHRLSAEGKDESPEADAVRDATDAPWESLTEIERQRVRNLSEDLYSLYEPPPASQPMNSQSQSKLNDAIEARAHGEWDRALEILRRWRAYLDPAGLSYLRGSIWLEAGDPETAVLFYEHASRLQPENGNYLSLYLHTLDLVDPTAAQMHGESILREPHRFPPVAVARASDTVFKSAKRLPEAEASQLFRRLVPILQDTLLRLKEENESGVDGSSYAMTVALLGFSHEFLSETQAALSYYSEGLQSQPNNDGLLVARGMLVYGSSARAEVDFELAIREGSPVVWPYFFLAHHRLVNGRFQECQMLCERALAMSSSNAVKSEIHEWLAISQSECGFPAEIIRKSFEAAIRIDPGNDRARKNLAAFETAVGALARNTFTTRSPAAIRTSVLAERRFSLAALCGDKLSPSLM